jgi:carbamoyl-phosphate synthase large subunit
MAGETLDDLAAQEQIPEQTSVKEVVLPFDRLEGSDPRLGPEMKSTGEVMGTASTFGKAYEKAQSATGKPIPTEGTAVVDLSAEEFPAADTDAGRELTEGFAEFYDLAEFDSGEAFRTAIREGEIDLIVSRNRDALEVAVEEKVTYFSTHASAKAALEARRHHDEDIDVVAVTDRPKTVAQWGAQGE